jgi:alpha-1,2-mannosyltransferase
MADAARTEAQPGTATSPRVPIGVRAVLAIAVVLAVFGVFVDRRPLDLDVYRTAGRAIWHGYDLYGSRVRVRQYGFTYPPFAALLFAVPARLPFVVDLVLMTVASLLSLRLVIRLSAPALVRALRAPRPAWALGGVVVLVVCEPVRATLWDGQINLLLAAMVLWDLLAPSHRWRGALVGVAAAIKLTPAIFVLYLLIRRQFRAALTAVGGFAAATVLAWAVLPHDSARFWLHTLESGTGIGDESRSSNLYGFFLRELPRAAAAGAWLVTALVTLSVGLVVAARVSSRGHEPFALGIVGVTGCLVSPVTWTHHWVWCIPWLVGVAAVALEQARAGRIGLAALAFVFVALNLVPPSVTAEQPLASFVSSNALTFAVLLTVALWWSVRWPVRR